MVRIYPVQKRPWQVFFLMAAGLALQSCGGSQSNVETAASSGKFPASAMAQMIVANTDRLSLPPSGSATVAVTVKNSMTVAWPAHGQYPVRLGYLLYSGKNKVAFDSPRVDLPADVAPGASAQLQLKIVAPPNQGQYQVVVTMLQEGNWWFRDAGAPGYEIALVVQ